LRKGELKGKPRSQSQVALSADSKSWFLLNASPDLRSQIESNSELQPSTTLEQTRHTPISAVILTNADLDHVLGLLLMRESQPIHVYATKSVRKILTEDNSMYKMLDQKQGQVKWTDLSSETSFELTSHDGVRSGLICTPYSIDAKYPIYVGAERSKELSPTEAVLALIIEDTKTKKKMAYLPGIAALDETTRLLRSGFLRRNILDGRRNEKTFGRYRSNLPRDGAYPDGGRSWKYRASLQAWTKT
jgi:pyrroloquinoline quinone biosynthesis protein B